MFFPASDQHGSPIVLFIVAAVFVGLLLGAFIVRSPRVGGTAAVITLPLIVVAIAVWFAVTSWDVGSGLFIASIPCAVFFLVSLAALICVALPGCLIRAFTSRRQ
jgi:hypothetical protein